MTTIPRWLDKTAESQRDFFSNSPERKICRERIDDLQRYYVSMGVTGMQLGDHAAAPRISKRKPVECYIGGVLVRSYASVGEAADDMQTSHASIYKAIRLRDRCCRLRWKYAAK